MKFTKSVLAAAALFISAGLSPQIYIAKSCEASFFSASPLERIEAVAKAPKTILNTSTNDIQIQITNTAFVFEKPLMQEHFNENYVESHKYPKAEFKGQVVNNSEINYAKDGTYPVKVKGTLTMHGETKDVETTGNVVVKSGKLQAGAEFTILLSDYKIEIPKVVKDNVSNTVKITVDCSLEPLKG